MTAPSGSVPEPAERTALACEEARHRMLVGEFSPFVRCCVGCHTETPYGGGMTEAAA